MVGLTRSATALLTEVGGDVSGAKRGTRRRRVLAAVVGIGLVVVWLAVGYVRDHGGPGQQTVAVIPYWSLTTGVDAVLANRDAVTMVSPWIYEVERDGQVMPLPGALANGLSANLGRLRAAGLKVVPTVTNFRDGQWQYGPTVRLLSDPSLLRRHVRSIVGLVRDGHLDGIDIDYEELRAKDRAAFTGFVVALANALHVAGKILSVDLFGKTTDAGYDERNRAQDYAAIGKVADQVRLMAYDYHWATSAPGPVAPIGWVSDVLNYARRLIPGGKIVLGVGLYGYDWSKGPAIPVSWSQVYGRVREYGAVVRWDTPSESPWVRYTDSSGQPHEVWFENAYSASAKFTLARQGGVNGVYLWIYGAEDVLTWNKLRADWKGHR